MDDFRLDLPAVQASIPLLAALRSFFVLGFAEVTIIGAPEPGGGREGNDPGQAGGGGGGPLGQGRLGGGGPDGGRGGGAPGGRK